MATGRPVRSDVGMTGEVTLNGRVLPIGGVKQKLLAAQRAGLTTVFVPQRNEPDLDDVPAEVLDAIEVVLTADVAELVAAAIEPARQRGLSRGLRPDPHDRVSRLKMSGGGVRTRDSTPASHLEAAGVSWTEERRYSDWAWALGRGLLAAPAHGPRRTWISPGWPRW